MDTKDITLADVRELIQERRQILSWIECAVYGGGSGVPFYRLGDVSNAATAFDDDLFSQMAAQDEIDKHGRGCGGWLGWYHGVEGESFGNEFRARRLVLIAEISLLDGILRKIGYPEKRNSFEPDIPDDEIPF